MQKVRMIKQWRGHAPGDEPELTDERAAELLATGYCCPCDECKDEPEPVTPEEPKPVTRRRRRGKSNARTASAVGDDGPDGRAADDHGDEAASAGQS